jgi:hypothetical protein
MTTFTTFFYDIGRKSQDPGSRVESYPSWIDSLLSLNINLVFYTTQAFHNVLTYKARKNLIFVFQEPDMTHLTKFKKSWKKYKTGNILKDTAEFACLTHEKFTHVLQTIEMDPFKGDYFAWIDAGISKVANSLHLLSKLQPKDNVSFMVMSGKTHLYKEDDFVLKPQQMIAGGFFIGGKNNMIQYCELMKKEKDKDILGLEQEHMVNVYMENRDLCCAYYGYYQDIITNYHDMENSLDHMYTIMIDLVKNKDSEGVVLYHHLLSKEYQVEKLKKLAKFI